MRGDKIAKANYPFALQIVRPVGEKRNIKPPPALFIYILRLGLQSLGIQSLEAPTF
jgi:hypothetical protein